MPWVRIKTRMDRSNNRQNQPFYHSHHKLLEADAAVEVLVELVDHGLQLAVPEVIPEFLRHAPKILDGYLITTTREERGTCRTVLIKDNTR